VFVCVYVNVKELVCLCVYVNVKELDDRERERERYHKSLDAFSGRNSVFVRE